MKAMSMTVPLRVETVFQRPGYRVRLRPICDADVDAVMNWINDPDVIKNFAGMSQAITREQELAYLQAMQRSETDRLFAIETLDGVYLGNAGIHKIYWPAANGRLGIVIGRRDQHGQGLGQEALRLLITLGFEALNLHKLWMMHFASNHRMQHLCTKLGFVNEGVLRDEYFHQDGWHDMVRGSLLRADYDAAAWRTG
jgi:RimJ/RimL family protein N-acetyltransferase